MTIEKTFYEFLHPHLSNEESEKVEEKTGDELADKVLNNLKFRG